MIDEGEENQQNIRFKPFLLNLKSDTGHPMSLSTQYDESRDVTTLAEGNMVVPLVNSRHLLSTQTKTEARTESDDDD